MEASKLTTISGDNLNYTNFAFMRDNVAVARKNEVVLKSVIFDLTEEPQDCQDQEIVLKGHHVAVTSLLFVEHNNNTYLFTAASDYIIQWDISDVKKCFQNGETVRGHVVISTEGLQPLHLAVCPLYKTLCYFAEGVLLFYNIPNKKCIREIEIQEVSALEFLSDQELISTTYNGYLFVWDIITGSTIWKTNTIHGASFHCVCSARNSFASGASNSVIRMYCFCNILKDFRECFKLDLDEKLIHIDHNWKKSGIGDDSSGNVLAMIYLDSNTKECQSCGDISALKKENHILCATERAIFLINCMNHNVQLCKYVDQDIGPPVMSDAWFARDSQNNMIYCAAIPIFKSEIVLYSIEILKVPKTTPISMIPNVAVYESSPLKSNVKLKSTPKKSSDQPLTFKRNIKSSGYTVSPRTTMFKPVLATAKKSSQVAKKITQPIQHRLLKWENAPNWANEIGIEKSIRLCEKDTCVKHIAVNDKSQHIACTMSDSTAHVSRLPLPSDSSKFKVVTGSNKVLQGCDWSNDKDLLITYTNKREVKIWTPPFTGESLQLSFEVLDQQNKSSKDLIHTQFYYLDKFLLSGLGNSLCLHKYHLHQGSKDDVKRYLSQGKAKLIGSWPMLLAQNITCLTAPNDMFSYNVITCGSDRSIEVFDFNECKLIHRYDDVHTRPVHAVHHCTGSSFVQSMSCDVFVTSSPADGIKLWDLRTQRCSRKYTQHSGISKCEFSVSPCGQYIATATDNKSICIYDVRKCFPIQNVQVKEKVTALQFLPTSNKIIAGTDTSRLLSISLSNP